MRTLLVVSPGFAPIGSADSHRVRMSLPYYRDFGWSPIVLAIRPEDHGGVIEAELCDTLPADVPVVRVGAWPRRLTRLAGVGDAGLRALSHLYRAGLAAIRRERVDLVFFSTTMFPVTTLGRIWQARTGVPFVIDMQDPWKSDYQGLGRRRNLKARAAHMMHGVLEPFAMRRVAGLVSVSPAYLAALRRRYPWIEEDRCATIPFGASQIDADRARALDWQNPFFSPEDGRRHGVAVGRGGRDMQPAAEILMRAVAAAEPARDADARLRLWFIGTDYAKDGTPTITPVATREGVQALVCESPARVPYLQGLRLLSDAHFTVILGSDDPAYSPSKVYPYLLSGRPFVAVMHQASPVIPVLRQAGTGTVVTYAPGEDPSPAVARLAGALEHIRTQGLVSPEVPSAALAPFSARELARRQCAFFDVTTGDHATEVVPCAG